MQNDVNEATTTECTEHKSSTISSTHPGANSFSGDPTKASTNEVTRIPLDETIKSGVIDESILDCNASSNNIPLDPSSKVLVKTAEDAIGASGSDIVITVSSTNENNVSKSSDLNVSNNHQSSSLQLFGGVVPSSNEETSMRQLKTEEILPNVDSNIPEKLDGKNPNPNMDEGTATTSSLHNNSSSVVASEELPLTVASLQMTSNITTTATLSDDDDKGSDRITLDRPPKESLLASGNGLAVSLPLHPTPSSALPQPTLPSQEALSAQRTEVPKTSLAISLPNDASTDTVVVVQPPEVWNSSTASKQSSSDEVITTTTQQVAGAKVEGLTNHLGIPPANRLHHTAPCNTDVTPTVLEADSVLTQPNDQPKSQSSSSAKLPVSLNAGNASSGQEFKRSTMTTVSSLASKRIVINDSSDSHLNTSTDDALAIARQNLTALYGSYLCSTTDACLADARNRLTNALHQTWKLRTAFTERVYSKYRVCLRPAQETGQVIAGILSDPVGTAQRLQNETSFIREEKEMEKKEVIKLNEEMASSMDRRPELTNIDNAEQLMYFTAGLNLVILPEEQVSADQVSGYPDRGPMNPVTGQRVRSISQAAAVAGEVMLDRTRKAAAMRLERHQRHPDPVRGIDSDTNEIDDHHAPLLSNYAVPSYTTTLSSKMSATTGDHNRGSKKIASSNTLVSFTKVSPVLMATGSSSTTAGPLARVPRMRHPALSISINSTMSLNPINDEFRANDSKPSAANAWLVAHSKRVSSSKSIHHRQKHPHPESLGGMKKATSLQFASRDLSTSDGIQNSLTALDEISLSLPLVPTKKDRSAQKPLAVYSPDEAITDRARASIGRILDSFVANDKSGEKGSRSTTKVGLLRIRKLSEYIGNQNKPAELRHPVGGETDDRRASDQKDKSRATFSLEFTLSVLHAVGLINDSESGTGAPGAGAVAPTVEADVASLFSDRLLQLRDKLNSASSTVSGTVFHCSSGSADAPLPAKDETSSTDEQKSTVYPTKIDIEPSKVGAKSTTSTTITSDSGERPQKRRRASSSPGRPSSAAVYIGNNASLSQLAIPNPPHLLITPAATLLPSAPTLQQGSGSYFHTSFAFNNVTPFQHFVGPTYMMHHPSAGDLAHNSRGVNQYPMPPHDVPVGSIPPIHAFNPPHPMLAGYIPRHHPGAPPSMLTREPAYSFFGSYPHLTAQYSDFSNRNSLPPLASDTATTSFLAPNPPSAVALSSQRLDDKQSPNVHMDNDPLAKNIDTDKFSTEGEKKMSASCDSNHQECTVSPEEPKKSSIENRHQPSDEPAHGPTNSSGTGYDKTTGSDSVTKSDYGKLRCFFPEVPPSIPNELSLLIQEGKFHLVIPKLRDYEHMSTALDYHLKVGYAVPLPKAFILRTLKERLNSIAFRSIANVSGPTIPQDVVVETVSVCLWANHKNSFEEAFAKYGRIDLDNECKQLIYIAVLSAVNALALEIAESEAKGIGAFADAAATCEVASIQKGSMDVEQNVTPNRIQLCTAAVVCRVLSEKLFIDASMDFVLRNFHDAAASLDEARLVAFRAKARERTLLAALLSRTTIVDEMFSNAFVSSLVRAGEAYGHDSLFEEVQNESAMASSMIPYDIFTEETGTWEDPTRPHQGFSTGLTGDELFRRAHARAMVQYSLRKFQDRHHFRGGTSSLGPYDDVDPKTVPAGPSSEAPLDRSQFSAPSPSPRPGLKRRLMSVIEMPFPRGTGSAPAKSLAVYDPKHASIPLEWDSRAIRNIPYGLHAMGSRKRSLSMSIGSRSGEPRSIKKHKRDATTLSSHSVGSMHKLDRDDKLFSCTHEVNWADVASVFHLVKLPKRSSSALKNLQANVSSSNRTIYAPFFSPVSEDQLKRTEDESDTEEDVHDEAILQRHQVILDKMKESLNKVKEERKKQQEVRKNRQSK